MTLERGASWEVVGERSERGAPLNHFSGEGEARRTGRDERAARRIEVRILADGGRIASGDWWVMWDE